MHEVDAVVVVVKLCAGKISAYCSFFVRNCTQFLDAFVNKNMLLCGEICLSNWRRNT